VAVEALNHPAITTNQMIYLPRNTTATILLDVTDEDADALVAPILKGPKNGRLFGRGTLFYYTPKTDFVGSDEFTYKVWDEHVYSRIAKVSITVTAPVETKPEFESVKLSTDGKMHLVLKTQMGKSYEISVSTNLVDWLPLLNTTAQSATLSVTDTNAPGFDARFYRALQR
ncbi:MAG: cadherin-like domain-containing protein, partial [Verrucomicrobiales bacterium]|nr:cadherin-like domain-containing protein [Verrucomicrobiales bacterium]